MSLTAIETCISALGASGYTAIVKGKAPYQIIELAGAATSSAEIVTELAGISPPLGSEYKSTDGSTWKCTSDGVWTVGATIAGVTSSATELNKLDGVTATATQIESVVGVSGAGVAVAGKATATESGGIVHKTVLDLAGTIGTLNTGAAHGAGIKLYDFPAGRILLLGAVVDAVVAATNVNANPNDTFVMSMGSVTAADDATLTSTEADIIPSTTITVAAGSGTFKAALASSAQFNGTTIALDLFINAGMVDTANSANSAVSMTSGTVTLHWVNLGDY
jgi:hypothetical protein